MTLREDGRYQESMVINGKRKYFYGKTKAEVLRKIKNYEEKQENGRTFRTVAEEWWDEHESKVVWNTAQSYRPALTRAVDEFGDRFIKGITPPEINRYIRAFSKTYADKTTRTQLLIFNLIFKYAVENGDVPYNPVRDLTVPAGLPKKKVTSPSDEDIAAVKNSTNCTFGMFAYWAMYTGMRRGELLALEWKDVNIEERTINITKSLYYESTKPKIKVPKTETSLAKIPILDKLMEKITPKKQGLVFPNEKGGYIYYHQFWKLWKQYQKESGITATPHQFRHAYATMLFEAGIPPEEMQILLRHAQLSTTMDVYTDIREKKQKDVFSKVYNVDML